MRKGKAQTGIVGCSSIDDYLNNVVKKHELTSKDKELFEDIGGEAINPILDDEFDFEDELKAFLGEN